MKHFLLLALLAATASPLVAKAASFDCGKARSIIEKAICNNDDLSRLDEQVAKEYANLLDISRKLLTDVAPIRDDQRQWLKQRNRDCGAIEYMPLEKCLRKKYQSRLNHLENTSRDTRDELDMLPQALSADALAGFAALKPIVITNASEHYDFWLAFSPACGHSSQQDCTQSSCIDDAPSCDGPGQIGILFKGQQRPFQGYSMPLAIRRAETGEPLVNSARLYDYQGTINVDDFNFDSHEDFAVQNGNHGSYGGPSYSVFLYIPAQHHFMISNQLSELTNESLGFFDVDSQRKRLQTFSKSGCCYHRTDQYEMHGNTPVRVESFEEQVTMDGKNVELTTSRLLGGKMQTVESKQVPLKEYYPDD